MKESDAQVNTDRGTSAADVPLARIVRAGLAASPPVEEQIDRFWQAGAGFEDVVVRIEPPARSLELLERLGPSPFERGGFPVIGFLATTYDKVSRYALERGSEHE